MYQTPIKKAVSSTNEMAFYTPMNFRNELKQVLRERNMLTAKSRKKVFSMLDKMTPESKNDEMDKRKSFRLQAIEEIVTSEKAYLKQLEILMQFFVLPLKEEAIIDDASHTALFGQIEMIYNLNGELLKEIELKLENVAHAFLKMAPFFKLYSVYAFDYRNALFILQDITSKNPVFRKFLENTESRPEVQRKLDSLMIIPIQRVPRYKLLLEQVVLYTSPADADFKILRESVKQVESTVSHINSVIQDQEITQMLINLQNSVVNRMPNIVKPSRKVIKEGILHKVSRNGTEIKRYCVLMSDIFMYCKILKERSPATVVENSLECCCIFPLKKCKVYEMFPGSFKITCQGDGIIFCTTDVHLHRTWVGFIKDAIDLHIQCRKTLRKESSKRKPLRKKDVKHFEMDNVISPNKRKCDYETIFRNTNRSTDSEEDEIDTKTSCFPLPKKQPSNIPIKLSSNLNNGGNRKRKAPPPPPQTSQSSVSTNPAPKPISKLRNFISTEKNRSKGILKRKSTDSDHSYGFVNRLSNSKSYVRANNVDNSLPNSNGRFDLSNESKEQKKDMLYPLRNIQTNNWPVKENESGSTPRKRVKFDETQDSYYDSVAFTNEISPPYPFSSEIIKNPKLSLKDRIVEYFSKFF